MHALLLIVFVLSLSVQIFGQYQPITKYGDSIVFNCSIEGAKPLTWILPDGSMFASDNDSIGNANIRLADDRHHLTLNNIKSSSMHGVYVCVLQRIDGRNLRLYFIVPLNILTTNNDVGQLTQSMLISLAISLLLTMACVGMLLMDLRLRNHNRQFINRRPIQQRSPTIWRRLIGSSRVTEVSIASTPIWL
jgi:hypothetical protein